MRLKMPLKHLNSTVSFYLCLEVYSEGREWPPREWHPQQPEANLTRQKAE